MIWPHHDDEMIVAIVKRLKIARLGLAGADADFGSTFLDAPDHISARTLLQIDLQQLDAG